MKSLLIHGNAVNTPQNLGILFHSHLFTFRSLVQLLLSTVKLNEIS